MFAVLRSSSSVKVHGQAKINFDLWLLLKIVLDFCLNFCKITFTQLSEKVWIVVYTVQNRCLTFDLPNILPRLLTLALTEDKDQSTGCIGVPPLCYLLCVVVWRAIPDAIAVMSLLNYIPAPQTCSARVTRSFLLMGKGRPCQTSFLAAKNLVRRIAIALYYLTFNMLNI